jgi:hypothetical protein
MESFLYYLGLAVYIGALLPLFCKVIKARIHA